jgi:ABC-type antimicrobial peptide transport system permease subunit
MNLAVALGAAVGTASLTGALLVGDSMRGSLLEVALDRLGRVDYGMVCPRFVREALASDLAASEPFEEHFARACPVLSLRGAAEHATSGTRANRVNVLGVNDCFWGLNAAVEASEPPEQEGRTTILNETLARELGIRTGQDILIRLGKPSAVSTETLLGRRDDTTAALRLTVAGVIPAEDLGAFSLRPRQDTPHNVFVPLNTLQRAVDHRDRVNMILVAGNNKESTSSEVPLASLRELLRDRVAMSDLGLRVRVDEAHDYVAIESDTGLVEPVFEGIARSVALSEGGQATPILTYLANSLSIEGRATTEPGPAPGPTENAPRASVPYSTVSAIDPAFPAWSAIRVIDGTGPGSLLPGHIVLNEWTARALAARPGDRITLTYYEVGAFGALETREAAFTLSGTVALGGIAADPGFTPEYAGVTDAANLRDWDPPFPVDFTLIGDQDETYWDEHRTTPKAFVTLADGRRLWASEGDRLGRATSVRITPPPGTTTEAWAPQIRTSFLTALDLTRAGLLFEPVRAQLAEAGKGTTDFGGLFIGLSFFLILSAAMLVALLFRLGVERRAGEIGLLLATGFSPGSVRRLLMAEGSLVAGVGGILGLAASVGYAWFMLTGLRSWWADAANAPFLRLHTAPTSLIIGLLAGFAVAISSIAWSLRGLTRRSPRALLSGSMASGRPVDLVRRSGLSLYAAFIAFALAVATALLPATNDAVSEALAFFAAGSAMLAGCLLLVHNRLRAGQPATVEHAGLLAVARLGVRNARRRAGRSLLTAGLIASATFLIAAIDAFHLDVTGDVHNRQSGTGGFALLAESAVPLPYNPATPQGREALNMTPAGGVALDGVELIPFRLRPGDESSCLSLYRPVSPRILGAPEPMVQRGGFRFSSTLAESDAERANPWLLLNRSFEDGAIPVIGDEGAVKWQFHLGLGRDFIETNERGQQVHLRFVALLAGSALQSELIVSEANFKRLFPSIGGHAFFLLDTAEASSATTAVEETLERELADFSFDVSSTMDRLAEYVSVQNTYLATFRMLGSFGLVLGAIGLTAVMLRNVWERRAELALLRALGFSRRSLRWLVLIENIALLAIGLTAGLASALLAIAPHIAARPQTVPLGSTVGTVIVVLVTGLLAGLIALVPTLRAPLLPALRAE